VAPHQSGDLEIPVAEVPLINMVWGTVLTAASAWVALALRQQQKL
jgi:hypothetical protein